MPRPTPELRKRMILSGLLNGRMTLLRIKPGQWRVDPPPSGQTGSAARALSRHADELLAEGKLMLVAGGKARLTDLGRLAAKPAGQPDQSADNHRVSALRRSPDGDQVRINLAESPLQWLASRKDPQGRSFLTACEVEAGERLRRDFTLAGLTPNVSARWGAPRDKGASGAGMTYSDTVIAARQRIARACQAVGPELSGLLLDICGFLKGLQEAEAARGWPVRTGKVVLKLGLAQLARHYGMSEQVTGRANGPIRQWGADDFRPVQDLSGGEGGIAADTLDHGPQTI